VGTLKACLRPS